MRKAAALRRLPVRLDRVDLVIAVIAALVVAHLVEYEMLELRPEIGGVADPRLLQISLGLLRDVPRIAAVALPGHRIADVADQHQGRHLGERIEKRR